MESAPQPCRIRAVCPADAGPLAELINALIARGGTTALEEAFTPEALADAFLTGHKVHCCFVACDPASGRLEGFQTLCHDEKAPGRFGEIGTFARLGGARRGIGSALFAATRARAQALGLAGITATIRADNQGGLAFYSSQGFVDNAVIRGVPLKDGTRVDRIVKRYALPAGG